jgi:predicted RNase H-like nuclease (RuvC/YqgF family)
MRQIASQSLENSQKIREFE